MLQAAILSAQKSHDIIVIENHKDFPEEPELPEPPPYLFKMVIPHDYKKEINGRDNIPVPVKYKRNRFRK